MNRPNILLICVDQMRGDCMSWRGHKTVETPYLDTLVNHGMAFTNAYSAVPSCIASRAALLTGLSQDNHKRFGYKDGVEWDYEQTIASGLAKGGYHTQCIGKMHVYPQRSLLGFHNVVLHDGYLHFERHSDNCIHDNQLMSDDYIHWLKQNCDYSADIIDTGLECNSWVARPWMYDEKYHPTNWTVSESIDFLRRRDRSKPFFLMTSFVRPHSPLDPPKFYFDMYDKKNIDDIKIGNWEQEPNGIPDFNANKGKLSSSELKRMKAGYYGCITHIDHQIGRLIQALLEYGVLHNTIIIFTSDHGDMLGDHYWFRKALPYEGSVNIPLIISTFGENALIQKGKKFDEIVELRDILPTLYDIAKVPLEKNSDGKSILKLLDKDCEWREYLHGEHEYGEYSNHYIVTKEDKYIYFPKQKKEQYFRKDTDPDELNDQIDNLQYKSRIDSLRALLQTELSKRL